MRLEELGAAPVEARGLALGELAFPVCRVEALLGADLGHAGLHLGHDLDLVLDGGDLLLGGELGLAESEHFGWYLGVGCYGVKKEKGSVDGIAIWECQKRRVQEACMDVGFWQTKKPMRLLAGLRVPTLRHAKSWFFR